MFERFRTRSHELERIDTGDHSEAEYARWQREMPWIHAIFGENRALESSLLSEIRRSARPSASILDLGAGSGTLLKTVKDRLSNGKPFLVGAELNADAACAIRATGLPAVQCDGMALPFAGNSFDHVFSTLTLHHLGNEEAVAVLREMARVSREHIFVVDLNRDAIAYYAYRVFAPLVFQRLTVEDGALSILRSFTEDELYDIAGKAGLKDVRVKHSRLNRLVLSARKP